MSEYLVWECMVYDVDSGSSKQDILGRTVGST